MAGRIPQLHIVHRAADGESVTSQLAAHLRTVVGTHSVVIDTPGGAAGDEPAHGGDVALVMIGATWVDLSSDGDEEEEEVISRVEAVLASPATVVPVLVDGAELPVDGPPVIGALRALEPVRLRTSLADHERDLVALESRVWREWMSAVDPALVVMQVDGQPVSAADFVDALDRSHDAGVRTLGMAASGMIALSADDARDRAPALAVVLSSDEPPPESVQERLRAAFATRRWGRVVIVGTGSIPGWVAGKGFDATLLPALGWLREAVGSTDVAVQTVSAASSAPAAVAQALGGVLEGIGGAAAQSTSWFSSLLGWKGAVAATAVVGVTAGVIVVAMPEEDPPATPVESTFDAGTQGWTVWGDAQGGSAVPTYRSDAGAPPGSIEATDNAVGGTWFWRAPSLYHSVQFDPADRPVLRFDLRHEGTGRLFDACNVVVVSGARGACLVGGVEPGGTFQTDAVSFTVGSEMWHSIGVADGLPTGVVPGDPIGQADLDGIIASVDELFIRGEFINGKDTGGLDNVSFGASG